MVIRFRFEKHLLTVVKVVASSEGTCNNCLFVEVFNYFWKCSVPLREFLVSNKSILEV